MLSVHYCSIKCIIAANYVSFHGSRPTAVNLSEAATKLQNLALKTAESATEAKAVFQVLAHKELLISLLVV